MKPVVVKGTLMILQSEKKVKTFFFSSSIIHTCQRVSLYVLYIVFMQQLPHVK